jgi:ketosteroid isomerase-like protein
MRILFALMAFVVMAGCAGEPKHPTWNNATGAEHHEQLLWQAVRDKDWANVERRLSATFVGVNADGQMLDRAGWLAYWKNAQAGDFSLGDVSVQPEGADMKVTYILHLQGIAKKTAAPASGLRVVSVWQQVKTRWMLTTTSITPIQNN